MRLEDIQVGVTYQLDGNAPTDRPDTFLLGFLVDGAVAKVREVFRNTTPPYQAEVIAVRVPYKKGTHGVWMRATRRRMVTCLCTCGNDHVRGPLDSEIEYEDETVEFTVHYTALLSLSDEIEMHLSRERWRQRFSEKARQLRAESGDES